MPAETPDAQPPAPESPPSETGERVPAREIVRRIESMIAGNAADGVKKYKVAGQAGASRELERYSVPELLQLLEYWRRRAAKEAAPGRLGGARIACYL